MRKRIVAVAVVILVILSFIAFIIYVKCDSPNLDPEGNYKIISERELEKNKEKFLSIVFYLQDLPYDSILINEGIGKNKLNFYGSNNGQIGSTFEIYDKNALSDIYYIAIDCKYNVIDKENNVISFQRFSTLDAGKGIAYSIDGHIPDQNSIQFLTKIEQLSEEGWYYYESDFNEWNNRQDLLS